MIAGEKVKQVKGFVYLGSMCTEDGKCEGVIERRLRTFVSSQQVSKMARLVFHSARSYTNVR